MDNLQNNSQQGLKNTQSFHKLDRKAVYVAILLFVLIILGMFIFALLKKAEIQDDTFPSTVNKTIETST
jgi:hypothetical protein